MNPTTTMTPTEHLQRIRARCVELLTIAEKRTPGKWAWEVDCLFDQEGRIIVDGSCLMGDELLDVKNTSEFISACAGSAEAGWQATIAAVDGLLLLAEPVSAYDADSELANVAINAIIAAWPEEVL